MWSSPVQELNQGLAFQWFSYQDAWLLNESLDRLNNLVLLDPDIFIPQFRLLGNEGAHHLFALLRVEVHNLDPVGSK